MRPSTHLFSTALSILLLVLPTTASAISILGRQIASGSCTIQSDNSQNSLPSTFTLTGVHRSKSGNAPNTFPISSTSYLTFSSGTALSISSSSSPSFTLFNGVLTSWDADAPCVLYQDVNVDEDAVVVCSSDLSLQNSSVNALAGMTWATGNQCLESDAGTEIVVLAPVFSDGVRHSKPFYISAQPGGDGLLTYCVGNCIDNGLLTSLLLQIVSG